MRNKITSTEENLTFYLLVRVQYIAHSRVGCEKLLLEEGKAYVQLSKALVKKKDIFRSSVIQLQCIIVIYIFFFNCRRHSKSTDKVLYTIHQFDIVMCCNKGESVWLLRCQCEVDILCCLVKIKCKCETVINLNIVT